MNEKKYTDNNSNSLLINICDELKRLELEREKLIKFMATEVANICTFGCKENHNKMSLVFMVILTN